jgi:hypothetical protein
VCFLVTRCGYGAQHSPIRPNSPNSANDPSPSASSAKALGLFLMTPQSSRTVDPVLHSVFRHWNIDVFIAHWLYVCAAAMIGVNVASRLNITPDQLRHHFRLAFGLPMTILVPITLALIVQSPDADRHWPDLFYSQVDYWLDAYWTLIAVFVIAILAGTIWALTLIRVDTRHRHATNIYIAACVAGIIVCMVRIATAWFDIDGGDDPHPALARRMRLHHRLQLRRHTILAAKTTGAAIADQHQDWGQGGVF